MGKAYVDSKEVGTFTPQCQGGVGKAYLNAVEVGSFNFTDVSGKVYLDVAEVGTFSGLIPLPSPVGFIQPKIINPKIVGGG